MRAFADALEAVPMALAENSGLNPIETMANIKSQQVSDSSSVVGIDCMQVGTNGKQTCLNDSEKINFPAMLLVHMFCERERKFEELLF